MANSRQLPFYINNRNDWKIFSLRLTKFRVLIRWLKKHLLSTIQNQYLGQTKVICWGTDFFQNKRLIKPLLVVRVGSGTNPKYGSHCTESLIATWRKKKKEKRKRNRTQTLTRGTTSNNSGRSVGEKNENKKNYVIYINQIRVAPSVKTLKFQRR